MTTRKTPSPAPEGSPAKPKIGKRPSKTSGKPSAKVAETQNVEMTGQPAVEMTGRGKPAPPIAEGFLTGQLLIAMPAMADPRFSQSVIYMCAHTPEGAMGLVLNRPVVKPTFEDLLKQLKVAPHPPARQIRLCAGGPVENARGFVLHTIDWTGEGSLKVNNELALTASLDVLQVIAEGGGPRECVLALGYAGWGPGQLDREIQENAWLSGPADETLLFDADHDTKWRRAFAKLKVDPILLSDAAGHA
jgi:putative transcriptional regulator